MPVLFIHGNASSATYWEEIMLKLPAGYRGIAPDLRGYGDTEDKLIDATRGTGDFVDDLLGLAQTARPEQVSRRRSLDGRCDFFQPRACGW